ncbi:MAG: FtsW/RodA/SpoVE family cell cycle protein [Phycisphaerales bacterium]
MSRSPATAWNPRSDANSEGLVRLRVKARLALLHAGWLVVLSTIALAALGVYCIDLASTLEPGPLAPDSKKQLMFVMLGTVLAVAVALPHYRWWLWLTWPLAVLSVLLLAVLVVPGVPSSLVPTRNGARRWIDLGAFDLQPAEVAKVAYVLATASYLRYRSNHRTILGLIPPAIIVLVPMALIVVEPDLGTSLLFLPALVAMLVAAGAKLRHLIAASSIGIVMAVIIAVASLWFAARGEYPLLRKHQVDRIQAVLDMASGDDRFADDRGFQGRQAVTLVGAGGWGGHTDDRSRALVYFSKLPEARNDMVFAVFANRFGFVGVFGLLTLYSAWVLGALWVAGRCKDAFGRLVVVGFTAIVATQALINLGETMGLLPITGMTLPFVSYGGSAMLIGFVMVGLIFSIGMRRPEHFWRRSFEFDDG